MQVAEVRFLGEQDGVPERKLKDGLTEIFREDKNVVSAYLSRVAYAGSSPSVALCLRVQRGGKEDRLVHDVGKMFGNMFGRHEHLDIIFVSEAQESELAAVTPAFFYRR